MVRRFAASPVGRASEGSNLTTVGLSRTVTAAACIAASVSSGRVVRRESSRGARMPAPGLRCMLAGGAQEHFALSLTGKAVGVYGRPIAAGELHVRLDALEVFGARRRTASLRRPGVPWQRSAPSRTIRDRARVSSCSGTPWRRLSMAAAPDVGTSSPVLIY